MLWLYGYNGTFSVWYLGLENELEHIPENGTDRDEWDAFDTPKKKVFYFLFFETVCLFLSVLSVPSVLSTLFLFLSLFERLFVYCFIGQMVGRMWDG